MLDPGTRKCGGCYENQRNYGWPIPDCDDPDKTGNPCPYPTVLTSLKLENQQAWSIWCEMSDQLVNLTPMSEPTFTLNLGSLRYLCEIHEIEDRELMYRKVKAVFHVYRKLVLRRKQTKTEKQFDKLRNVRAKLEGRA